jgi:transcriptional regulator with XRE-family HTH domain
MRSEQIRAERALLDWNQADLAAASGVSATTIKRMEAGNGPVSGTHENVTKLQLALEAAGVEFLKHGSPGVRLRPEAVQD